MREELLRMAAEIRTEWGMRKALNYIRIVLEEEAKKESPREGA